MKMDTVETKMLQARVKLLLHQPLYGQIIMHLDIQDASQWCPTAATDGKRFYYNRDYMDKLTKDEMLFVHGHEILHCVFAHMFRRGSRDKLLWNAAIDFITNYILVKGEVGTMPAGALWHKHYTDEFSAEELYALLERKADRIPKAEFDMHLDAGDDNDDNADPKDDEGGDGVSGPPRLSAEERAEIQETIQSALVQAAQNTPPGKIPAAIQRLLDQLVKPKVNWRALLANVTRSVIKHDYTYTRLSRRSWSSGMILPGQEVMEKVEAVAWLDGSGSTSKEMITDFLSECNGIMRTFRDFSLTIGTFDTAPYNVKTFTPANASDISRYEFIGGGGTAPSCCWDYMKENKLKPHVLLVFTDG